VRILVLTASLPYPLASGGAIRTFGILHGLHEAGHQITLLSFGNKGTSNTPLNTICERIEVVKTPKRSKLKRLQQLMLTSEADIARRYYSEVFKDRLLKFIQQNEFDLIQFEAIEIAGYLPLVRAMKTQAALCFDTFNAEAALQQVIYKIDRREIKRWPTALYSWLQSKRLHTYEGELCRMADLVIAVSEQDAVLLRQYRHDDKTFIVPSGIFVDDYQQVDKQVQLKPHALVFTGKMDYRPNVDAMIWFADHILPQIPDAHLTIVGQKPHPRLQHLPQQKNVTVTGWVESIKPYLHAADVYVAPLRMGSGTRLKILEAMASGCAIVATSLAAAGLSDEAKSTMRIADDESSFANTIVDLLKNPEERQQLGQQACEVAKKYYDWSMLIPQLLNAYREVGLE